MSQDPQKKDSAGISENVCLLFFSPPLEAEAEAGIAGSTHRSTPILLCVYFFMEAVGRSDLYNEGRRREVEATAAVCIKAE